MQRMFKTPVANTYFEYIVVVIVNIYAHPYNF